LFFWGWGEPQEEEIISNVSVTCIERMQSNPIKTEKQMERRKQTEMISTLLLLFGKALKFKHCMGRQSATQKR
jgi:hypothetical protein